MSEDADVGKGLNCSMSCADDEYGWKVSFDHKFKEKRDPFMKPRVNQLPQFVGMLGRYLIWYLKIKWQKRKPFIDGIKALTLQQIYGVPIGGIGGGTIGRGFRGEFCRFQLVPGLYEHHVVLANQFIVSVRRNGETVYQQVLSPLRPKKRLQAWKWGFDASNAQYRALYPRSWYTYNIPDQNLKLICRQISPIIPGNYKDSSLPVAVFVWSVENLGSEPAEVSIAFTFKNGTGSQKDRIGGCWTESYSETHGQTIAKGVLLHQKLRGMDCTIAVSAAQEEGVNVTHLLSFDPNGTGADLWLDLWEDGCLASGREPSSRTTKGHEIACAVAAQCKVPAGQKQHLEMSLAWDMPNIRFKSEGVTHQRRYTRWFGNECEAAGTLSAYALANCTSWESQINDWQQPILQDISIPAWYKSALFNELYFISDGGSVWVEMPPPVNGLKPEDGDVRQEFGRFAYLEGHEYRMFNTYDVHFYASFALVMLWPKLQLSLQYDMKDAINFEDSRMVKYLMHGNLAIRKTLTSVPHDVGDPEEEPWESVNSYLIHDTAEWRDLNLKFVLQVYRDFVFCEDQAYLTSMWPVVKALMNKCLTWDANEDGMIENSGTADQTYDSWIMKGPSAYCGGLWLASLHAISDMAKLMDEPQEEKRWQQVLEKAQKVYAKLWTGDYYKFDSSNTPHASSIMSDQLCGHWYLKACGVLDEVFPKENVQKALRTIYENNVLQFKEGTLGAVNGMMPDGTIDLYTVQSEEVWTGVTYALAATMLHEGMLEEGFCTAKGMFTTMYNDLGMAFQTPEALYAEKHYRAIGYMRPLSIWAMQWALQHRDKKTTQNEI